MHNKRVYNIKIAIERLKNYCALQDKCQWDVMKKMNQDVIYFDPPWGGRDYKNKYFMDLFLGIINMIDIIRQVKNKTKLIVYKVPKNYNFFKFFLTCNFDKISVYKIYRNKRRVSYYVLVLES